MRVCPRCMRHADTWRCAEDGSSTVDAAAFRTDAVDPLEGALFAGDFRVLRLLAIGGFGLVYEAFQLSLDQLVALKLMHESLSAEPSLVQRFEREVHTCSRLKHPNTVRVLAYGKTETGRLYYSMELLHGMTLADLINQKAPLPEAHALHIANQVVGALSEAHALGIVHRDLKPENIYLTTQQGGQDVVKVLDFGIAQVADARAKLTMAGQALGTPTYMSPEQVKAGSIDGRADLYALGVMLYEMLTGRPPFKAPDPTTVMLAHIESVPPPISEQLLVSRGLRNLVMLLLQKRPEARPATAKEVLDRIAGLPPHADPPRAARPEPLPDTALPGTAVLELSPERALPGTAVFEPPLPEPTRMIMVEPDPVNVKRTEVMEATQLRRSYERTRDDLLQQNRTEPVLAIPEQPFRRQWRQLPGPRTAYIVGSAITVGLVLVGMLLQFLTW